MNEQYQTKGLRIDLQNQITDFNINDYGITNNDNSSKLYCVELNTTPDFLLFNDNLDQSYGDQIREIIHPFRFTEVEEMAIVGFLTHNQFNEEDDNESVYVNSFSFSTSERYFIIIIPSKRLVLNFSCLGNNEFLNFSIKVKEKVMLTFNESLITKQKSILLFDLLIQTIAYESYKETQIPQIARLYETNEAEDVIIRRKIQFEKANFSRLETHLAALLRSKMEIISLILENSRTRESIEIIKIMNPLTDGLEYSIQKSFRQASTKIDSLKFQLFFYNNWKISRILSALLALLATCVVLEVHRYLF
ncbi:hypothetical protein WICMUC_002663 [Wickerhamomyces mucosus]|uniref:Uncharacterized protein n=1 Tax=Wickerhamomyces mucosus TaxID=1378264 RepID=A0A9P8TE80_9ASCO|nr:hypothetical protein WICMUC_002663 [Wickerhamomyces mucosus]